MKQLELLAPAKNLECGIAAIDHGADAVYIGASRFGARAAAGNSVEDIHSLCDYAHQFEAKVYVTVNTIIYDSELDETLRLIDELAAAGVDALLVQDMGLVGKLSGSKLPLHASTQTDNRTAEKVAWLRSLGFRRVVLARELSLEEIAAIYRSVPDVELEVFVHGALCVSYSGVCYASQYCFNRSANRGECAQFCRLKFDLIDADGKEILHQRHLLSLKDLCQIDNLEALAEAGACSFKIEGRLKDVDYVKNVVSAYNLRLNKMIDKHPDEYCRSSAGRVEYLFAPNLNKTFNRGFTNYFLQGRQPDISSFDTPKAMGEYVGKVKEIRGNSFNVAGTASFANGDGLCFINDEHELEGFRVNRAEGNRLFPLRMPSHLRPGLALYRNNDEAFGKLLSGHTAVRKIPVSMSFSTTDDGFSLEINAENCRSSEIVMRSSVRMEKQLAKKPQYDNIVTQLTKLGNTPYICDEIWIRNDADRYFIPSSVLTELRREALASRSVVMTNDETMPSALSPVKQWQPEYKSFPYLYNISNRASREFYHVHGLKDAAEAFEIDDAAKTGKTAEPLIMQCRHCLRYSLGYCVKRGGQSPTWHEPLYLRLPDGRRFRLQFNCNECQMNVYASK
jgi:23S rRNA 5-hydroxycytidine C2501 synthase